MISALAYARSLARDERKRLGASSDGLLERLQELIAEQYEIEFVPTDKDAFLQGSRAEIVLAEGCLYYDRKLDTNREAMLEVMAHEYGHLLLHHEYLIADGQDLVRGSAFLNSGAPALSRYSPRSQQEAQASAFAAELICPASEIFERWRQDPSVTPEILAAEFGATSSLVRFQLAEGLHDSIVGQAESETTGSEETPTPEQEEAAIAVVSDSA
jgi:Zn-dependent peptidase ImmA (M78 family)